MITHVWSHRLEPARRFTTMHPHQTASIPLHPPVIVGSSTGELGSMLFDGMKTSETPLEGTLDWYREKGKTDPDIAALVAMVERTTKLLVTALEAVAEERRKNLSREAA